MERVHRDKSSLMQNPYICYIEMICVFFVERREHGNESRRDFFQAIRRHQMAHVSNCINDSQPQLGKEKKELHCFTREQLFVSHLCLF